MSPRPGAKHAVGSGAHQGPSVAKETAHSRMQGEESLSLMPGCEAAHLALSLTPRLVGSLGAVARVLARVVPRPG